MHFTPVRESDPTGEQPGSGMFIPGAVFMVAQQGEAPAGKLYPNLVTAAGV